MPRADSVRNAFLENRQKQRYSKKWLDFSMILFLGTIISLAFWSQAPAGSSKPATPAPVPKPPAAAKPNSAPKPSAPKAVSPVKAAAAKAVTLAATRSPAKPGDPVVLTIGQERITKGQFEEILAALPVQLRTQLQTPAGKREFARQFAEIKSLTQEAKQKMGQDEKLKTWWQLQMDQSLADLYLQEATKVDEAASRKYYEDHQAEFQSANGRHILIRFQGSRVPLKPGQKDLTDEESLAKVNEIRTRLTAGEDFAAIARQESDDTGSGAAGGSLGDFPRGMMVGPFDQAAFTLPIGQISEPVKTQFGYHIIQIQSRKTTPFEQVKAQVEQKQKQELSRKVLDDMKKRIPVVMDEAYFGKD